MLQDTTCTFPKTSWLNKFIQEAIVFNQEMVPKCTSLKPVEPVEELKSPDDSSPIPIIQISPVGLSSNYPLYTNDDNLHEIVHDTCNILDDSMDLGITLDDSLLETSMEQLTIQETDHEKQSIISMFGFEKFTTPPLLTRHPPPASGRDDDINKLREILDDILMSVKKIQN
ncbi:uncharacterized protein LOC126822570 [Patella vulgata]|uniref:uncharacterized protein LOC126822570 n=1 Tax=Patella vulgata TaxID=6465 RepID=UPI0024A7E13E|nr:uncharacterized protein LOC126822570 [Patella vulgata]